MKNNIIIGLALKNEEDCIITALESIKNSINTLLGLHNNLDCHIVICLNNCTDNTEAVVNKYISDNSPSRIYLLEQDLQLLFFHFLLIVLFLQ